jgi:hypothetical protein
MKQFLLACVLVFSSCLGLAQSNHYPEPEITGSKSFPFPKTNMSAANKTTGPQQRLKSGRFYIYSDTDNYDSVSLKYSNGRGSAFDFDVMGYKWNDVETPSIQMDTAFWFVMTQPASFSRVALTAKTYDAANNLISLLDTFQNSAGGKKTLLFYNVAGELVDWYYLYYQSGSWDTFEYTHYDYTNLANGKVKRRTAISSRVTDTFDIAGKLIARTEEGPDTSGNFYVSGIYHYYYNSLNQLEKVKALYFNSNTGSSTEGLDTFIYNASSILYSEWISSSSNGLQFVPHYKVSRHFNSQNLPDSIHSYIFTVGSWVLHHQSWHYYNAQGNPVRSYFPHPTWTGMATDSLFYYYEDYDLLAVTEPIKTLSFSIYPNPATDALYVTLVSDMQGQDIDVRIYDMEGRLLVNANTHNSPSDVTVPVGQLKAGIYILEVLSGDGKSTGRKQFIKY